jgi:hypothetical protein
MASRSEPGAAAVAAANCHAFRASLRLTEIVVRRGAGRSLSRFADSILGEMLALLSAAIARQPARETLQFAKVVAEMMSVVHAVKAIHSGKCYHK